MNNERYCATINSRLAQLVVAVRQSSASNLHSINIHAESFFREFLNVLFGWKLSNANAVQPNAAGIDLLYPGENVVVQVSSTTTHEKVQSSLEKSARFPGAHFYFMAIADDLPNYKKAFDKHGLVFDPNEDILDTKKLYDLIVHHKGYGAKRAIEVQRELFDLVEKYFSRQERRKELHLRPLGQSKAKSLFEYNAEAVPLMGRASEMEELKRFVTSDPKTPFSWWAITGPGAAGKTRLAYELQKQLLQEGEWDVVVIPPVVLDRFEKDEPDLSDACPGNTLLIVDYVQKHTEALALLVKRLSDPNLDRSVPLRLLLLERDIRDEDGQISWLAQIWGNDHHVHESFFGRPLTPMRLSPLTNRGDGTPDPLEMLIRSFADKLCEREDPDGAILIPLPAGKEAYLRNRLEDVDPGMLRPLFAMILADAFVRDPETELWSREKLLNHIADRELGLLAERIAPFHDPGSLLLPNSFRVLWMTATVLGAGDVPLPLERIRSLLPQVWDAISKASAKHKDQLESWVSRPEEALLHRVGLLVEGRVQPLRPDLLGEYMVLAALSRAVPAERDVFLASVLSEFDATVVFFGRILDDYGTLLLHDEKLWVAVFPNDPQFTNDHQTEVNMLSQYARFLRTLFEQPRDSTLRGRLCLSLEAFAAQLKFREVEASQIFFDAASVLYDTGNFQKALRYYDKTLKIQETELGPGHPSTATTYNNMACTYRAMADYQKALKYCDKALIIRETVLGLEHPDTAMAYNNTASVYSAMGDYPKALEYYDKALKIKETVLGMEHPDTAVIYNNMARVYSSMGDNPRALEYYDKALKIQEAILGLDHPHTATTFNNIALVYAAVGDYPKALEYYEKALEFRETVLGTGHPSTATTYNNIALVYTAMDDYPKALEYYEKDRTISETILGTEHPDTAVTYNNIASVYTAMGDYPKALEYYDKALKIVEVVLGRKHPFTAATYNNIAGVYQDIGDYPKAREYYKTALKMQKTIHGAGHPDTAATYNNIAVVCSSMGDYPKALKYYKKALKIVHAVLAPENQDTAKIYYNMASVYDSMDNYPKALNYCNKARIIQETVLGLENLDTATTYRDLALLFFQVHNLEKALSCSNQALGVFQRILGPEHPETREVAESNEFLKMISLQEISGDDM